MQVAHPSRRKQPFARPVESGPLGPAGRWQLSRLLKPCHDAISGRGAPSRVVYGNEGLEVARAGPGLPRESGVDRAPPSARSPQRRRSISRPARLAGHGCRMPNHQLGAAHGGCMHVCRMQDAQQTKTKPLLLLPFRSRSSSRHRPPPPAEQGTPRRHRSPGALRPDRPPSSRLRGRSHAPPTPRAARCRRSPARACPRQVERGARRVAGRRSDVGRRGGPAQQALVVGHLRVRRAPLQVRHARPQTRLLRLQLRLR